MNSTKSHKTAKNGFFGASKEINILSEIIHKNLFPSHKNCFDKMMLTIQNFLKSYNNHKILEIEDLQIPEGIHWFKGINGSGKSTLFRSIAGILPYKGEIKFNQLDCRKDVVAYRLLVNLSEAEPLYPDYLSGYDLLKFIADAKRLRLNN